MRRLLHPRGVAIIGASPDNSRLPGRPVAYFQRYGFAGNVYPVNPKHERIGGLPCLPSIAHLPDDTDLALIMLPAQSVATALEELGKKGVAFAISVAGGFAEAGDTGAQERLADICRTHGIRLIGPNCVGLINPRNGLTATFSTVLRHRMPPVGGLAVVSQSGALANSLLQSCNDLGIGLSCWVSTGNEADLGAIDFIRYLLDDEQTSTIALFIEALKDGEDLVTLGREARRRGKTVIALRAGRSDLGRAASLSHTGKLAGSPKVWQHVARQAGILQVATLDDLVDLALALQVLGPLPHDAPRGLGILTISGGLGVLISDLCADRAIPIPGFAPATRQRLRDILPSQSAVANPVDTALFADENGFRRCAEAVVDDPGVGTILIVLTSLAHDYEVLTAWLEEFTAANARAGKARVVITFLSSSDQLSADQRDRLLRAGALVMPDAARAVEVLAHLDRAQTRQDAQAPAPDRGGRMVPDNRTVPTAAAFVRQAGIPLPASVLCSTPAEARKAAAEVGYPVALKVASADLPHKTEAGGVRLGLASGSEVEDAYREIEAAVSRRCPDARIDGFEVQRMVTGVAELIVGCVRDPEVGPVVMAGSGGIFAEVLEDVTFRSAPVSSAEATAMIEELKAHSLLGGFRGRPAGDIAAAADAIAAVSRLFARSPLVREVDINPLVVLPEGQGVCAVDVLIAAETDDDGQAMQHPGERHAG